MVEALLLTLVVFGGAALLTVGVWWVYEPAALMVAGGLLLTGAWRYRRAGR